MTNIAKPNDKIVNWNMWLTIATIFLFLATLGLVVIGYFQWDTARNDAKTAKKYLDVAQQQLKTQKEEFELTNRPIIYPIGNPTGNLEEGAVVFQNLGNLPPDKLSIIWEFRIFSGNTPGPYKTNKEEPFITTKIGAGKWINIEYNSGITESEHFCFIVVGWAYSRNHNVESDSITFAWDKGSKTWHRFPVLKRKRLDNAHLIFLKTKQDELKKATQGFCK
jgi:hypothetical protein